MLCHTKPNLIPKSQKLQVKNLTCNSNYHNIKIQIRLCFQFNKLFYAYIQPALTTLYFKKNIYSALSHPESLSWTCFPEPKNMHIFKSIFLPLKSINPTSTAFSAELLFILYYQYATLNMARVDGIDVLS